MIQTLRNKNPRISFNILSFLILPFLILSLAACSEWVQNPAGNEGQVAPKIARYQKVPELTFLDLKGDQVSLYPLLQKANKTALIFYRGYWCSYCQGQFAELRIKFSELEDLKAQIIGVSVDEPHLVDEFGHNIEKRYLQEKKQYPGEAPVDPPFLLLSDTSREAIIKLGIGEKHPRFGLIARPTTLLLDREGIIQWFYIGKSPDDRPAPDAVLTALRWMF